jgi:hypothetical protein
VNRSRAELAAWCAAGAILGWLAGIYAFLVYYSVDPRQAFRQLHPLNSPVMLASAVGGTVLFGCYAVRGVRDRIRRVVLGSIVGGWLGGCLIPAMAHRHIFARLLDEPLFLQDVMVMPVIFTTAGASLAARRERPSRLDRARYQIVLIAAMIAGAMVGPMVGHIGAALSAGVFVAAVAALILD